MCLFMNEEFKLEHFILEMSPKVEFFAYDVGFAENSLYSIYF